MRNTLGFLLLTLVLISCEKNDDDTNKSQIFKAGIISDSMVYNVCNFEVGSVSLDLNKDSSNDISLFTIYGIQGNLPCENSSLIRLTDTSFQILVNTDKLTPKILDFNEPINKDSLWTNKPTFFIDGIMYANYNSFVLAENYDGIYSDRYIDYWLGKKGYVGIRNEYQKGKFKYGWIKIEVKEMNKMIIFDYAYLK